MTTDHMEWKKSSYSRSHGECVEVAELPSGLGIQNSKNPTAGYLSLPAPEWRAFLAAAKHDTL
ncbi:MAG: DUF397 domain-containing protein [Nocardiopsaceae bacterium]|nr:DUF397 domain-containing protein [Nocardiopsaceae bacterium]